MAKAEKERQENHEKKCPVWSPKKAYLLQWSIVFRVGNTMDTQEYRHKSKHRRAGKD